MFADSRTDDALCEMATTLTATYSSGDRLFVAHVGHSRAYLFRDGDLRPLTTDQTLEHRLATTQGLQPVERTTQDLQHILTDAIGGRSGEPHVEVEHFWLKDGDRLVLCSNGLCEALDDERHGRPPGLSTASPGGLPDADRRRQAEGQRGYRHHSHRRLPLPEAVTGVYPGRLPLPLDGRRMVGRNRRQRLLARRGGAAV